MKTDKATTFIPATRQAKILALVITAALSTISIMFMGQDVMDSGNGAIFTVASPGIFFSLWLALLFYRKDASTAIWKVILLTGCFCLFFFLSFVTFGFGVPVFGAAGAFIVMLTHPLPGKNNSSRALPYILTGAITGLAGLLLYYGGLDYNQGVGWGFGGIVLIWQIAIGLVIINEDAKFKAEALKTMDFVEEDETQQMQTSSTEA